MMRTQRSARQARLLGLAGLLLLAACKSTPAPATPTQAAMPISDTSVPASAAAPTATPALDAQGTARAYLDAWQAGDYATMYRLLAPESRASLSGADLEQ